ncbi:MAG: sigma-70 family RNA polymerase sigma factor [Myxococcota bacterium]
MRDGAAAAAPSRARDEALLERLRAGEEAAFEALVRTHGGPMLAVARRMLRDPEEARDVVQEAFLNAFRSLGKFQGGSLLSTWLHRIVVNASLMKLRTRRRKPETSIEELLPKFLEDGHQADPPTAWRLPADEAAERKELLALVRRRIDELPETYRTVLLLRDVEGLDTAESAALLGIAEGAVKTRLHRARQALRTLLDTTLHQEAS